MKLQRLSIGLVLLAALVSVAGLASASDLWLHVRVEEEGGATVKVNLPVSMLEKAIPMIPEEHFEHGRIHLDEWETDTAELRELWQEIKGSPDMTFVTVEDENETVKIWKQEGYLLVNVRELEGTKAVDVRVPITVVDALLSGEESELNITAAIEALAEQGEGELVTVTEEDEHVRIWVDRIAEAE